MSNVETTVTHIGAQPPPAAGHNSSKVAAGQLRSVVERIEALEANKKDIADDIRDVYAEAKGNGYDLKALRTIVRLRKMKDGDRTAQEEILDTYKQALGMLV
jgi:uncharacterized protein (UPF0335 family)